MDVFGINDAEDSGDRRRNRRRLLALSPLLLFFTGAGVVVTVAAVVTVALQHQSDTKKPHHPTPTHAAPAVPQPAVSPSASPAPADVIDLALSPAKGMISARDLLPGDKVVAAFSIKNSGKLPVRYSMSSVTSESKFAKQLVTDVKTGVSSCNGAGFDKDGSVLYGPGVLGTTDGLTLFGNKAPGKDPGDRLLPPNASESLCVRVKLPRSAGNEAQGLKTSTTLLFNVEQVPAPPANVS